ncbi:MAG TPA: glycerophosphodiester phosphodiesterase family protein [Arenimonas sp.]|nr:glycerophosphodiester phosphodiesterase family protein [Arenimonas sp.]HEX4854046.1 glycerophosphodiester phosphodiesterase family protein [Arenimonas sp.]
MTRIRRALCLPLLALAGALAACAPAPRATLSPMPPSSDAIAPSRPWVIAHRGASALRPEHTLAAYALAIEHGADAIEPDLVMTRDGVLVARHENALSDSTDVAARPGFASRRTRKQVDGAWVEDWFTEDFTLAELKTLRAIERLPALRSTEWDGRFDVPTFDEIIALAAAESAKRGRDIGLVPEIKHPTYFAGLGLAMEQPLLDVLAAHDYTRRAPVVIQSFETANLHRLRAKLPRGGNVRLLQLIGAPDAAPFDTVHAGAPRTYLQLLTEGLGDIATYADAIGPHYRLLQITPREDGIGYRSALVDAAHAEGLQVIAYTFRPENVFIESGFRSEGEVPARDEEGSARELRAYASAGVDAVFVDDPAAARKAIPRIK